jgi:hypothetical protein
MRRREREADTWALVWEKQLTRGMAGRRGPDTLKGEVGR